MNNVQIQSDVNWVPLSPEYVHDNRLEFKNLNISSKEGITLTINNTMSAIVDETINNYSRLSLTDTSRLEDFISLDLNVVKYPEQFTSYLLMNAFPSVHPASRYFKTIDTKDNINYRHYTSPFHPGYDTDDNGLYYTFTLHDDHNISISHNDNYSVVYLTVTGSPGSNLEFHLSGAPLDTPISSQKFNYIIDKDSGYLIMYKKFIDKTYYISSVNGMLTAVEMEPTAAMYPNRSVFLILPYFKQSLNLKFQTDWVSYETGGNQNNLNINESKSYNNIFNNFLLNTQYSEITGSKIPVDITILKNQLTSDYNQSRRNPFINYRGCDHREYDKIFTGTNQIKGTDNVFLGYNSYSTDIILEPDHVTYFHTPQDMYPFDKININDSGLVGGGAIGGDSPIKSDKIFKMSADYKNFSPYGAPTDEESGTWLCSWLKTNIGASWNDDTYYSKNIIVNYKNNVYKALTGNKNEKPGEDFSKWEQLPDAEPYWVDRYYNPKYYTVTEALKLEKQYNEYSSKFDYLLEALGSEKDYVFDKKSDLVFEPGCLYAYYRIGSKENNTTINSNNSYILHDGIEPVYYHDRSRYTNTSTSLMLDGSKYIETETLSHVKSSDFTISVWLEQDDWTIPTGSQIIGNYTNNGFGIFNKQNTTPYIIINGLSSTDMYNTNLDLLFTIPVTGKTCHLDGNENIHIASRDDDGYQYVYQYDTKGLLLEKTLSADIIFPHDISDITIDNTSVYVIDVSGYTYKYNANTERKDLLYAPTPRGNQIGSTIGSSSNTFIALEQDYQYRINCDTYTVDMSGNIWFVKDDNTIYKYIPYTKAGIQSTYNNTINGQLVIIVAEETEEGSLGNTISVTGDGSKTISTLIDTWNSANSDNKAQVTNGKDVVIPDGDEIQLTGGLDAGGTVEMDGDGTGHLKSNSNIVSIKSDYNNNIWSLLSNNSQTKLVQIDNLRNVLFSSNLSAIDSTLIYQMSGANYMDMVTEFNTSGYESYIIILNQPETNSPNINYIKIDLNGEFISSNKVTLPGLNGKSVSERILFYVFALSGLGLVPPGTVQS